MARPLFYRIYRADDPAFEKTIERSRESLAEATRVLQTHETPDTFLGRQHHDFIPSPEVVE